MIDLIEIRQPDDRVNIQTEGLSGLNHLELSFEVQESLREESEQFLRHISHYLFDSGKHIQSGETMVYGYWLVKFQKSQKDELLEVWEYSADASTFIKGVELTLGYWRDQNLVCNQHQAAFAPPRPDELTVVSAGVVEGLQVQGVRYPSPKHMSGWWLTTDSYDGNLTSLRREHTYHVTAARPDLAKYLALPVGFRFNFSVAEEVWFDEKVFDPAT